MPAVYWVGFTVALILISLMVIDWRDVKRCLPAALAGLVLSGVLAGLPPEFRPLELSDTGPLRDNLGLTLFMQAINGPLVSLWYVQKAGPGHRLPLVRTLTFTALTTCWAWMAMESGRLQCAPWWAPWLTGLIYSVWFLLVWQVHVVAGGTGKAKSEGSPPLGG